MPPIAFIPRTQDPGDAQQDVKDTLLSRAKNLDSEEPSRPTEEEQQEALSSDGGRMDVQGRPKAPDGGWGWMVLSATLLVLALTIGFPSCIGIFYTDLQTEFRASNTQTSWVPSVMMAMLHAGGPLCSAFVERFGCRVTIMVGGVLSGLSMAAGSFARTITDLYITSMVTGLGFSFSLYPSVTMIGQYFVRRRVFANALVSTGTALGYSIMPLVANALHRHFGWRGSFLVLGGVLLNCCVCGAVMRPLARPPRGKPRHGAVEDDPVDPRRGEAKAPVASRLVASLRRHLAYDLLLSNARYRAFAAGVTWVMLGFLVPQVYLVPYATGNGVDLGRAALLMSVIGLVSIATRLASAVLLGRVGHGCVAYTMGAAVVANGLSNSIAGARASFPALLAYVVMFGASQGLMGSLVFSVLMDLVDMEDFPPALGLVSLLQGIALLVGPPLAGMLVDATGQYSYVFHACNVAVSSGGLFLLGSFCYFDWRKDGWVTRKAVKKPSSGLRQGQVSGSEDPLATNSIKKNIDY